MERYAVAALALLAVTSGVAAANEPPVAAAGLDQTVIEGNTVYLDAGGSRDPDGDSMSYTWEITTPDNRTVAPACSSCEATEFTPPEPGEYEVTVTVTDENGASRSDVMLLTVRAARAPAVDITGPSNVVAGATESYDVSMDARDGGLRNVTVYRDGEAVSSRDLDVLTASVRHDEQFNETGTIQLRAAAQNTFGKVGNDTLNVSVSEPDEPTVTLDGPNETSVGVVERYAVNATPGDYPIEEVRLTRDDDEVFSSSNSSVAGNLTFANSGPQYLQAEAVDEYGKTATVTVEVIVDGDGGGGSGGHCEGAYVNFGLDGQECHNSGQDGMRSDAVIGDIVILNNGRDGLQMNLNGSEINIGEERLRSLPSYSAGDDTLNVDKLEKDMDNIVKESDSDGESVSSPSENSGDNADVTNDESQDNRENRSSNGGMSNRTSEYNRGNNRNRVVQNYNEYRGI
ncbi:PKD domain-containing protein [Halomicrobium salinisoli]|uniref:PKD domain-containing protein n=1 Tax=Halomicrobium salinisoli TaxID=2878391 RepID=UPI001CF09D52|nr:PKD domain-containing protein [Halomicrobium salinisoli]